MPEDKFSRMVRSLPSFYQAEVNKMIRGLLLSWGLSDDEVTLQIKNTKDQIFTKKAEGNFLDFLGNNVGVDRSPGLGIDDNDFRNLIPVLSFFPKQVRATIISLLDAFWGPSFTRPNLNTGNVAPFDFGPEIAVTGIANFVKGRSLVKGTGTNFLADVAPGDYIKPSAVSGTQYTKVSSVLDNETILLSSAWDNTTVVGTAMQIGPVRVLTYNVDGRITKTLRFKPNAFDDLTVITIEELVAFINADLEHNDLITGSEFIDPVAGDKLNLRTTTPGLQGSIQILGGDANDLVRLNFDLDLHRDIRASVFELNPNEIVVTIPSSVPVLRRSLRGSSHPRQTKTVLFSSNIEVYDFSGLGASSTLDIDVEGSPIIITFTHSTDFADSARVTSTEVVIAINRQLSELVALAKHIDGYKAVGLETTNGNTNYQVTGGTANAVLSFDTTLQEDPPIILPPVSGTQIGSFIFDPDGQLFTVTQQKSTLSATIPSGTISPTIALTDASDFPNQPGQFIINYGRNNQEGPIDYNSRPNNSSLLIDASHVFEKEHLSGSIINFVVDQPTIPRVTGADFAVYITGTEQARIAAQQLIKRLLAAGVVVRFVINFPEFLFECVCRGCDPDESPDFRGTLTGQGPLVF